jgi:Ulp1 family protease
LLFILGIVPYQTNGYDCGVFVSKYALCLLKLARDNVFTYAMAQVERTEGGIAVEQDNMPFTRLVTKSDEFSFDMSDIEHLRRDMKTLVERLFLYTRIGRRPTMERLLI